MAGEIIIDVKEVLEKLDTQKMRRVVGDALWSAADIIRTDIKKYPASKSAGPQRWVSAKQRRWFWWALRTGQIRVPYRRTGKLGQSWTKTMEGRGAWPTAVIGTHMGYARWVQDADRQTAMHRRTPWPTAQGVAQKRRREVVAFIERALERWAK